jgi:predicted RNA-binding Zn-ribbon protein involved in translation (DUF1610 family)
MRNELRVQCPVCGHGWTEWLETPMVLTAAAERLKAVGYCPMCGEPGAVLVTEKGRANDVDVAGSERLPSAGGE